MKKTFYMKVRLDDDIAHEYYDEAVSTTGYPPKKTVKVYKMFRTLKTQSGKIFPLFINNTKETKINIWQPALFTPIIGYAPRPGWHSSSIPYAPHLMKKDRKTMQDNRLWAECEIPDDYDWNSVLKQHGAKQLTSLVPHGGFYYFNTNKIDDNKIAWRISGAIKVTKILTLEECDTINKKFGVLK